MQEYKIEIPIFLFELYSVKESKEVLIHYSHIIIDLHMHITKPPHKKYALYCFDDYTYTKDATVYSGCKRWGSSRNLRLFRWN